MRLTLTLSPNREPIPFNYQHYLVGAFHRWLGPNVLHDDISLYSLSWLSHNGRTVRGGLDFPRGAYFYISAPDPALLQQLVRGIFAGTHIRWGMEVKELKIEQPPPMNKQQRFLMQSPILLKQTVVGERYPKFCFPGQSNSDDLLTQILRKKMQLLGLSTDIKAWFDDTYQKTSIKKVTFKGIDLKAAFCPVLVAGAPEAVQAAWLTGLGHGTGIGFGAVR